LSVMTILALPAIRREDYESFRFLLPELPQTFEEYVASLMEQVKASQQAGDLVQLAHTDPGAFIQFCKERDQAPSPADLNRFAERVLSR